MHFLPEQILGYRFNDVTFAQQALTHRSFLNEKRATGFQDYQRLEFLGDAVLGLMLADQLLQRFPGLPEGDLSRMRASLVDQPRLAGLAVATGLQDLILLGKGAEQEGGRCNPSILSDVFEALLGAIYLDGGFKAVQQVVSALYTPLLQELAIQPSGCNDAKSALQELLAVRKQPAPTYRVIDQQGPDHDRQFSVVVSVDDKLLGQGSGRSKKAAQQAAAEAALLVLQQNIC